MPKHFIASLILAAGLAAGGQTMAQGSFTPEAHWVCVSQTGYNTNAPKRFTVPTAMQGTVSFYITAEGDGTPLFKGTASNGLGDFTAFTPTDTRKRYVIHVQGGGLPEGVSYPFRVAPYQLERAGFLPSVWFMNDARSMTGTHHSAYGGCPWRDGTYYSYEMPSLIWLFLSNPKVYTELPATISYDSLKALVFSPDYKPTKERNDESALAATKKYFTTIEKPMGKRVPDVIMDLHWGLGYYMVNPETQDPSGDPLPKQLHPQTLAQFAYFLYAYPELKQWFSEKYYRQVLSFTLNNWQKTGLLDVQRQVGTTKGRHAPGFSVLPNLLLFEVAKREHLPDAAKYMQAAYNQTAWIIDSLSLQVPLNTKGQRMSEYNLMTGLATFRLQYPDKAPAGLQQKINEWADVVINRSDNPWDFRRYDLDSNWTVPAMNEVGNVAGFPASALLAAAVIKDPGKKARLEQIAYAHFDNLYGRNPLNVHAAHHPEMGFEGITKGYPRGYHENVTARLELCRGTISCVPGTEMYPFNPTGKDRHLEGWVNHNTAWNVSLAVLNWYDNRPQTITRDKDGLKISWQAPLMEGQTLPLTLLVNGVVKTTVHLKPANGSDYTVVVPVSQLKGLKQGDKITAVYGLGFLAKKLELTI
ncbi:hypothetical protein SAMN05444266_110183 [Chitinophaga jiangningensis]|uniref:Uncharacterized protein n=1 Tax=Chitinophaga jiangningensis TaxID=1419482 RepID=A0A1M7L824_9BACT|nr:hypothetical protein [Chitinophaga jiangningensis]SHM74047.1 hypothetical protein SAMN05444266_110183 [Chitinophaga jiangningensis]